VKVENALLTPPSVDKPSGKDPKRIHDSAVQFESLLIGEMLKVSRQSGGGWLGTGDDEAGSIGVEVAEQQLAQMLASHGGLGLTRLIEQGLTADARREADFAPAPAPPPKESAG
jgi:Rod binding domain-containing protein